MYLPPKCKERKRAGQWNLTAAIAVTRVMEACKPYVSTGIKSNGDGDGGDDEDNGDDDDNDDDEMHSKLETS